MKEFNSQICTSRKQSERLLTLGLKKETADMVHIYLNQWDGWYVRPLDVDESIHHMEIPAWSLHRLIEMMPDCLEMKDKENYTWKYLFRLSHVQVVYEVYLYERRFSEMDNVYNNIIDCIEWLIKEGHFNKEYLV